MLINAVAPFAGAWIEIVTIAFASSFVMSLPSRERGLKCFESQECKNIGMVAPFAGAWIEIQNSVGLTDHVGVAPFAGAWIEIVPIPTLGRC